MDLNKLGVGKNPPHEFNVVIEIPANSSPIKYEVDKESGALLVDRFVGTAMSYPVNYGFVPNTLSEDGDPVDVLVVTPFPLVHSSTISCRAIGVLKMEDESGIDAKIIALPTQKICPMYSEIESLDGLPKLLLDQIEFFFKNYKSLEPGKWVKLKGYEGVESAHEEINQSIKRYQK